MFDHVSISVSDVNKSKNFYIAALKTLDFKIWVDHKEYVGFGTQDRPHFWLNLGTKRNEVHIAFTAKDRKSVDEFYRVSLEQGAKDNGKPGLRPQYHENYYGAFVVDLDGNNVEAVCHKPE